MRADRQTIFLCWGLLLAVFATPALAAPERIVAAGGDITEIVYLLGEAHRLVAVDTTSNYPPAASSLPRIGYVRALSAEGVLSLRPDLVLGSADMGPEVVVEQLQSAGVPVLRLPESHDYAGVLAKIRGVAGALGVGAKGEVAIAELEAVITETRARIAALPGRPRVLFILGLVDGVLMAAGSETSAAGIIELAGGRNAMAAFAGFKPLSIEAAAAARADYVLMMSGAVTRAGGIEVLLKRPEMALMLGGEQQRLLTMDGMLLLGFGPRLPLAVRELAGLIHPR